MMLKLRRDAPKYTKHRRTEYTIDIDIVSSDTRLHNFTMSTTTTRASEVEASRQNGAVIKRQGDAPANALNVAEAKKEPPPEKPDQVRLRSFVLLSFWAIIIFLGLPIWWKTTTIYRADLPLDQMMDWADGRVRVLVLI